MKEHHRTVTLDLNKVVKTAFFSITTIFLETSVCMAGIYSDSRAFIMWNAWVENINIGYGLLIFGDFN